MVIKMAKIANEAAEVLCGGGTLKTANTVVKDHALYLHGNKIAWLQGQELHISTCGWSTRTTMQHLNAVLYLFIPHIKVGIRGGVAELRYRDGSTEPFEGVVVLTKND